MPRLYFHRRSNGQFSEDRRGRQFASGDEACAHAVSRNFGVVGCISQGGKVVDSQRYVLDLEDE